MEGVPDYGQYAQSKGDALKEALEPLAALVQEALKYEREMMAAEEALKQAKDRYRAVTQDALPKAMADAGMTHGDKVVIQGLQVTLRDKVENSIPVARREEAWDWLEANGHADIVKREVTVAFAVGESDRAKEAREELEKKYMRSVADRRWAEPQTVKSLLKQMIDDGKTVPRDVFGVRELRVAEIKVPK